jgi:hypothetical protein
MRRTKASGVGAPAAVGLFATLHRLSNRIGNARARRRRRRAMLRVPAVPVVPVMPSGTTCPGAMLPVRTHAHAHTLFAPSGADQQRDATWADGNSTKRAPATGTDGRRFPTTGCQLLRIPTLAPGRIAAGQRSDHGCLGYTPCRAAAWTRRAYHPLPPRRKSGRTYANAIQLPALAWVLAAGPHSSGRRTCS